MVHVETENSGNTSTSGSRAHEDEEHREWEQTGKVNWMKRTNEFGSVGGPENKRSRIRDRSEQMFNVQWRSWEKSVLVDCATVRRFGKWSRHNVETKGKCNTSCSQLVERQFREGTDSNVQEGTPGPYAAKIGRSQWDDHAYTNNRRTVGGNSRGGKRGKGNGSAFAKSNGRTAMIGSSTPGVS